MDVLREVPTPILIVFIAILVWVLNKLWEVSQKAHEKKEDLLQQNTIALVELKTEMRNFRETLEKISRKVDNHDDDINALHKARREGSSHEQ